MPKVTGIVKVYVDGDLLRTLPGEKFNPGGVERTPQKGHSYYGESEQLMEASVEVEISHLADTDLVELNNISEANLVYESDNGDAYQISPATVAAPSELTAGEGKASLKFIGPPARRL